WFGGHKGFGIAMMVEVLAGVLADSCFGRTENTRSEVHGKQRTAKGFLMIAVDPTRFLPGGEFRRRVDVLVRDVRSSRPAAGFDRVMVPGEREHRTREERLRAGIPLPSTLVEELDAMAAELGRSALEREEVA